MGCVIDDDLRYRVVRGRDARFDGWLVMGVASTGIYCRPSCPGVTTYGAHVRFYPGAAAAPAAGFRGRPWRAYAAMHLWTSAERGDRA